ncbi:hypothetical protein Tco_1062042, partial [Tanacetum coccineum]
NKEKVTSEANVILDWGSEQESEYSEEDQGDDENIPWESTDKDEVKKNDDDTDDDKSINLKQTNDEETEDELIHGEEQVNDNEDEKTSDAKVTDSKKTDEEITDAEKADAQKAEEVKNDVKKAELPPSGSSLFVSLGFEIPHIQSPYVLNVHVSVIFEPSVLTPIPETPSAAPATTLLPPSYVSTIPHVPLQSTTPIPTPPITTEAPYVTMIPDPLYVVIQRVFVLEKDVKELKEDDNTTTPHASLKRECTSTKPSI